MQLHAKVRALAGTPAKATRFIVLKLAACACLQEEGEEGAQVEVKTALPV
jgi:hypothetical protein